MKVLVTGGAGFIGSHIVEMLIDEGHIPIVIDNFSNSNNRNIPTGVTLYQVDILSDEVEAIFQQEQPDIVMHLAAQVSVAKSVENPTEDAAVNVLGTIKLLTYCVKYSVNKFIFSSSSAVYGEVKVPSISESTPTSPISFYGTSKLASESYIKIFHRLYQLPYTILRYANVYGPRQKSDGEGGVVSIFIHQLLDGITPTIYGDGLQTRDFVYVKDIASANLRAISSGDNGIYNIGTNSNTSINDLYQIITKTLHSTVLPTYKSVRDGDIRHSQLQHSAALKELQWKPTFDLSTGIDKTVEYFQQNQKP